MNQDLQRIAQDFNQRRAVQYVVHTPETVQQFADLTARVAEQIPGACLEMFEQIGMRGSVLARLMESARYEPRQEPIAEVRMSIDDDIFNRAMRAPSRMRWDIPDLPEGWFDGMGRTEYVCRVPADYQAYVETVDSFVRNLAQRRVVTSVEPPTRYGSEYWRTFHLSVNQEPLPEMSPVARIVTEALQNGIPLGEAEPRLAHMRFLRYNAGQGRVGSVAERSGHILTRQNDIYVVSTTGEFCMGENDRVTRALNIPEELCFDCDRGISTYRLAEDLETALAGQDLNGRRVFFVGSINEGCMPDDSTTFPRAIEMLRNRRATVYATNEEAKGLI